MLVSLGSSSVRTNVSLSPLLTFRSVRMTGIRVICIGLLLDNHERTECLIRFYTMLMSSQENKYFCGENLQNE